VFSIEQLLKIDSDLEGVPHEELEKTRLKLYELGQLIFDDWLENGGGSKYPTRVLHELKESNKIKV
jgi:hypothetical protein